MCVCVCVHAGVVGATDAARGALQGWEARLGQVLEAARSLQDPNHRRSLAQWTAG